MRYKDSGNLHLDFHGATNTTINYISEKFGVDAIREIFFRTGRDVYKSIRENLAKGDVSELLEHWNYYFSREQGSFSITEENDSVTLRVNECPAIRHIKKLGLKPSPCFCDQTEYINRGICEDTGFEITTIKTGEASCVQILRRSNNAAK